MPPYILIYDYTDTDDTLTLLRIVHSKRDISADWSAANSLQPSLLNLLGLEEQREMLTELPPNVRAEEGT